MAHLSSVMSLVTGSPAEQRAPGVQPRAHTPDLCVARNPLTAVPGEFTVAAHWLPSHQVESPVVKRNNFLLLSLQSGVSSMEPTGAASPTDPTPSLKVREGEAHALGACIWALPLRAWHPPLHLHSGG